MYEHMMDIIIYGAGGLGREIASLLQRYYSNEMQVIGYVDDGLQTGDFIDGIKILPNSILEHGNINIVFGIANPKVKQELYVKLRQKQNVNFPNIIAKSAIIDLSVVLGEGVVISDFCWLSKNVILGNGVFINVATTIGHDANIGDFCSVMPQSAISGYVSVDKASLIGAKSFVLQGVKVGSNTVICAGSAVFSKVDDGDVIMGNPAHILRKKSS